jgi:hypothetical protein
MTLFDPDGDSDDDGLSDDDENNVHGTNEFDPDTDADRLGDRCEALNAGFDAKDPDADGDTILDGHDPDLVPKALRCEMVALWQVGRIDGNSSRRLNRRIWRLQEVIARGRERATCRQLDRWSRDVARLLVPHLTDREIAPLLELTSNLRATVNCPV